MADVQAISYDEVPYDARAHPETHADTLATVAALFGMSPAPVANCRVLELGCSSGFNIIPMAATLPGSRFVGIDQSPRQISIGQDAIERLDLSNIELRTMDILDAGDELGQFDYIICHGVYSWVPAEVREKILEICPRNLAPDGVAYVSYNCYPGWHPATAVRQMMIYHTQRFTEPGKRVEQARALLDYLVQGNSDSSTAYAGFLKEEADLLRPRSDSYLLRDHLEHVNQPVYFHEFAARAAAHGLQYLWEADFCDRAGSIKKDVKDTLDRLSTDLIRREQYLDFLVNRRFRMTLLCHEGIVLDRSVAPERMSAFRFVGCAAPLSARVDVGSAGNETFRNPGGPGGKGSFTTDKPALKAAMLCLFEAAPRALTLDELCDAIRARLDLAEVSERISDDALRRSVAELLRQCVWFSLVLPHVHASQSALTPGERPVASPTARFMAETSTTVTNLRHQSVTLTPMARDLLRLLDGRHDRTAILDLLVGKVETGNTVANVPGPHVEDAALMRQSLGEWLDTNLDLLARHSLLVG